MCEERERLIGYVYDEGDAAERKAVEEHLASCVTCRREIRGLRSVRQDLLAWDVPEQPPVWRPMQPVRKPSLWSAMPAWGLAAAAVLILMVGAAGGAATHALLPRAAGETALRVESTPAVPSRETSNSLAALEQRVLRLEKSSADIGERVQLMSSRAGSTDVSRMSATTSDLARQVNVLTSRQDELSQTLLRVAAETVGLRSRQTGLQQDNRMLVSLVQGQNVSQGFGGSR